MRAAAAHVPPRKNITLGGPPIFYKIPSLSATGVLKKKKKPQLIFPSAAASKDIGDQEEKILDFLICDFEGKK